MTKRPFNKIAYDDFDKSAKLRLVEVIEKNSNYKLHSDLNIELYKAGDVLFKNGKNEVLFENEVRENFDNIVQDYDSIHIPIRKRNTPADFYIVWRKDLLQFILIKREIIINSINNIINVQCNYEMNQTVSYVEDFVDIPKNSTTWYVIGQELKLIKLTYD